MKSSSTGPNSVFLYTVYFIYFFCGMTLCFEGVFLPEFKELFQLNYQQQMYTLFAKNIPFLLAVPIGLLIKRAGFKNCLATAMLLYAVGTLLLVPGLKTGVYSLVLAAFFIIGTGFNFQLVAGNPLLSGLGPPEGGASRLNLGNALGAVAQIIAPVTLTLIIPSAVTSVSGKLPYITGLFGVIGILLVVIAVFTLLLRSVDLSGSFSKGLSPAHQASMATSLWSHPKVILGFLTIFVVLGAEAGLFGLYRNYLEDPAIAGLASHQSQRLFTVYFAVFALGRLVGSWVQKRVRPASTLLFAGVASLILMTLMITSRGNIAITAITALGFFVSIFFPTLYALAIEGLGDLTAQASGLLTMGFLGCAVLPVLQGKLADTLGLQRSFVLCLAAYVCVLLYAWKGITCKPSSHAKTLGAVN
jgi:MFS transporter, FHS family, L-fucose permease